jgi:hypothetical protein
MTQKTHVFIQPKHDCKTCDFGSILEKFFPGSTSVIRAVCMQERHATRHDGRTW